MFPPMRHRRPVRTGLLLATLVLTAAACGSSKGATNQATTQTTVAIPTKFCAAVSDFIKDTDQGFGAVPDQVHASFTRTMDVLGTAIDQAPASIKPTIESIRTSLEGLGRKLAAANWDTSKVSPAVLGAMNTPQFQTSIALATGFVEQNCSGYHPANGSVSTATTTTTSTTSGSTTSGSTTSGSTTSGSTTSGSTTAP